MPRVSNEEIFRRLDAARIGLADSGPILDAVQPRPGPGPYALFHHLSNALERVSDVKRILQRLIASRDELSLLNVEGAWLTVSESPFARTMQLTHDLRLDYESLFHFGSVLLDQLAHAWGYLAGVGEPENFVFHNLVQRLDVEPLPAALVPLRRELRGEARWLHFWMRTYRNGFVVHADRPWQRSTVYGLHGDDFALFTPSPPGWEDDDAVAEAIGGLLRHAPEWLQSAQPDHWERVRPGALLARVVENIGAVERQADREHIAAIARRAGLHTPTFQIMVATLANFASRGTEVVKAAALEQPSHIKLGKRVP